MLSDPSVFNSVFNREKRRPAAVERGLPETVVHGCSNQGTDDSEGGAVRVGRDSWRDWRSQPGWSRIERYERTADLVQPRSGTAPGGPARIRRDDHEFFGRVRGPRGHS